MGMWHSNTSTVVYDVLKFDGHCQPSDSGSIYFELEKVAMASILLQSMGMRLENS